MSLLFLGISGLELVAVVVLVLLLFGADSLPGIARTVGKVMREFRKASNDIKKEFDAHTDGATKQIKDITDTVTQKGESIKRDIEKELDK